MIQWITFKPRYGNILSVAIVGRYRFTLTSWGLSIAMKYGDETLAEYRMRKLNAKSMVDSFAKSGRVDFFA